MVPGRDMQSNQPGRPGKQELLSQPSRRTHKGTDTGVHVYSRNENKIMWLNLSGRAGSSWSLEID